MRLDYCCAVRVLLFRLISEEAVARIISIPAAHEKLNMSTVQSSTTALVPAHRLLFTFQRFRKLTQTSEDPMHVHKEYFAMSFTQPFL
jgi:hypothetical protein